MLYNSKFLACVIGVIGMQLLRATEAQLDISKAGILQVAGEKQYFIDNTSKVNFYKALELCAAMNMTLASIESFTEQQNLRNLLTTNSILSNQYWLSGNDLPLSREFVWFGSGSLFSYTSWASGVHTTLNQRCVRTDGNFNWLRDFCTNLQYFICERPVLPACGLTGQCNVKSLIIY